MQSELLGALLDTMDSKIFTLVLQLIVVGAIFMWIKDLSGRVMNFFKLRMGNFGRGTPIKIGGFEGRIHQIGFSEVEIHLDDDETLLMPVEKFMTSSKVIVANKPRKRRSEDNVRVET